MGNYYLRVEAVNLSNSLYDTNDISTVRGGGYKLLDIVKKLANEMKRKENLNLETISIGASAGLYRIESDTPVDDYLKKIEAFLIDETEGHATFVVDALPGDGMSFNEIQESLISKNRWSQMKQLTVSWGCKWKGSDRPCTIDGIRPGIHDGKQKNEKLSESVEFRHEYGRKLRNRIYSNIMECPEDELPGFTDSMEMLSDNSDNGLEGKIAFIYIDGNKFGKIRSKYCNDEQSLKDFDNAVQNDFRKAVLGEVLQHMESDESSKTLNDKNETVIRLETLLWGGDEIEWVVPAWKGWEILKLFYEFESPKFKDIPLTHAAGIVFCHHNAPILRIRKIAHDLADLAKSQMDDIPGSREKGDLFHYLILESFDMLEGSLGYFLDTYYDLLEFDSLTMKGSMMSSFSRSMEQLRSGFPRTKVYEIIAALKQKKDIEEIVERGIDFSPSSEHEKLKNSIESLIDNDPHRWFAIADLWDFA